MPDYWLDSDSLIQTKNGPYGFDIAPSFWSFIKDKLNEGIVSSSLMVFSELEKGDEDDLLKWTRERKDEGHFPEPDEEVQEAFRQVAEYVNGNYPEYQSSVFLTGADAWLIAHAMAKGGIVVTFEVSAPNSQRPKIPDVARHFDIETQNIYQMVRTLALVL